MSGKFHKPPMGSPGEDRGAVNRLGDDAESVTFEAVLASYMTLFFPGREGVPELHATTLLQLCREEVGGNFAVLDDGRLVRFEKQPGAYRHTGRTPEDSEPLYYIVPAEEL